MVCVDDANPPKFLIAIQVSGLGRLLRWPLRQEGVAGAAKRGRGCRGHSWPREDGLGLGGIGQHLLGQALVSPPIDMTTSLPVGSFSGPRPGPPGPEPPRPVLGLHFQDVAPGEAALQGERLPPRLPPRRRCWCSLRWLALLASGGGLGRDL